MGSFSKRLLLLPPAYIQLFIPFNICLSELILTATTSIDFEFHSQKKSRSFEFSEAAAANVHIILKLADTNRI